MGRFLMLHSDTRAMGRVLDVVWYDLSVTKANGSVTYPIFGRGRFGTRRSRGNVSSYPFRTAIALVVRNGIQ